MVGIDLYQHAPRLGHARNDAEAMAKALTERFGFPSEHVSLLLDGEATLGRIRQAVHRLARTTVADDRVLVFYAGHGHTVAGEGRDVGFLVPAEGDPTDTATLLPWEELVTSSRMIPAKHVLFIMDACYGGLMGMRAVSPGAARFARDMISRHARQLVAAGKADQAVADCGGPRRGHSLFTGHLLDGLDGRLHSRDGLLSANTLMAYVSDRVANDAQSQQTPHYGPLAGDGDFFFSPPTFEDDVNEPRPATDPMVEVPASLTPLEEAAGLAPVLERVKDYLADSRHRIRLSDLMIQELRGAQRRLGEECFSVRGSGITGAEFATRLLDYESAMGDMIRVAVLLGYWAEDGQQGELRRVVNVLGGQIEAQGGLSLWLALRSFPVLLAMYAGGIAAMDADNYASVRTLLLTPVHDRRHDAGVPIARATADAMLDVDRRDAFKMLPGLERRYTPLSEYLFTRMQPIVEDLLFLGKRYEALFDRFEVLYALSYADVTEGSWGPLGRFAWKYRARGRSDDPFSAMVQEASRRGDDWAPLKAGMFAGSHARFAEVARRFKEDLLDRLNWM